MSLNSEKKLGGVNSLFKGVFEKTRPDTRLPQSLAGGQGQFLRSLDHLGRSSEVKK